MKRLLCLLLFALPAFAQDPTPAPETPPSDPVVDPGMSPANPANPSPEETIDGLNYPDAQITDILRLYEQYSGKQLIKDANLAGQNISITVPGKITKSEAASIIEATLLLNNYALVPYGENQVKVLNITTGKSPRSEGLRVYASPAGLPDGDSVITYYMPFKYLDSQEALQTMQAQATGSHPYAIYLRIPSTQALLITENTSVIRQLLEIKELIDVPPAKIVSEFVPLQRADAERVAETITKMIEAQKSTQSSTGAPPNPGAPPPPQNQDGANPAGNVYSAGSDSSPNSLFSGQIQLVPDTRTNRILVIARPSSFPYVKSLIQSFDQAVGLTEPLEVPLKYVSAGEILPVLGDLLAEDTKDANGSGGGVQTPTAQSSQSRSLSNNRNSSGSGTSNGSSGGSSLSQPDSLENPDQDTGPESKIVGKTRIIADKKSNSILVIGPPESLEKCRTIIARLDKKPQQVYLSAVIGQLTLSNKNELGVDLLQPFTGTDAGVASSAINRTAGAIINPAILKDITQFPVTSGLNVYGTIGDSLSYYIRALESTNRFKVLSRPVVYTANNKLAVISSGQRIPYPRNTLTDSTNASNTVLNATIDYEEVNLELQVIPLINANNEVTLQIVQTNDTVSGDRTVGNQTAPVFNTQNISTTVTVANKNTVVLGGLISDSKTKGQSGVPVLSSLPLLGGLFKSTTDNVERNELLVFIQPNVVGSNEDAVRESAGEELRTEVAPPARKLAEPPVSAPTPIPRMKVFKP